MNKHVGALFLLIASWLALIEVAKAAPPSAAVLVVASGGVEADTIDALGEVIAAPLEQDEERHVSRGAVLRAEIEAIGFTPWTCLRDAACEDALAARYAMLLFVDVTQEGRSFQLAIRQINAAGSVDRLWRTTRLDGWSAVVTELRRVCSAALERSAILTVRIDQPRGHLFVDGIPLETMGVVARMAVALGAHSVTWEPEPGLRIQSAVMCSSVRGCSVVLSTPQQDAESQRVAVRGAAWGTLSVALISAGVATGLAIYAKDVQEELTSACAGSFCTRSAGEIRDLERRGEGSTLAANVLFGVAGAAAAVSMGLFIEDALSQAEYGDQSVIRVGSSGFGVHF